MNYFAIFIIPYNQYEVIKNKNAKKEGKNNVKYVPTRDLNLVLLFHSPARLPPGEEAMLFAPGNKRTYRKDNQSFGHINISDKT